MVYQLKKSLNVFHLLMISLGGSWGGGMLVSSFTKSIVNGPSTLMIFVVGSIFMYIIMSVLLEMSVDYPSHGSFVEYSHQYLNPGASLIIGWCAFISFVLLASITAVIFGSLLQYFFPIPPLILSMVLIIVFAYCNILNVQKYANIQSFLTIIKITMLVGLNIYIVIFTLRNHMQSHVSMPRSTFTLSSLGLDQIITTLFVFCLVFTSLEYASIAGGEAKDAQKTLPRTIKLLFFVTLAISTFISVPTYFGLQQKFLMFFNMLYQDHSPQSLLGLTISTIRIFEFLFLIASLAMLNSAIYAASRLLLSLAKNSSAPAKIAIINNTGVPKNAVLITCICVLVLATIFNLFPANTHIISIGLYCIVFFMLSNWIALLFIYLYFYRSILIRNAYLHKLCIAMDLIKQPSKIKLFCVIITIFCLLSILLILLSNQTFRLSFYIMFVIITFLSIINALRITITSRENE